MGCTASSVPHTLPTGATIKPASVTRVEHKQSLSKETLQVRTVAEYSTHDLYTIVPVNNELKVGTTRVRYRTEDYFSHGSEYGEDINDIKGLSGKKQTLQQEISDVNLKNHEGQQQHSDIENIAFKIEFYKKCQQNKSLKLVQSSSICVKTQLSKEDRIFHESLMGNLHVEGESKAKIVRIFTSSTFTDTQYERNFLMENAYTKLKSYCQENGYQFQIVDMRWGIGNEAMNDHSTTELCMKELKLCQKLSTGPNFVTFLSHKYGYRPCPRLITKETLEAFLSDVGSDQDKELICRWYKEDLNSLTPSYILQPIGRVLPSILSDNQQQRKDATQQWNTECRQLRQTICSAAKRLLQQDEARRFLMSVTEAEIMQGIMGTDQPDDRCIWFKRNIIDIDQQTNDEHLSNFKEQPEICEDFEESQNLLQSLKTERIPPVLKSNIFNYDIEWRKPKGLDPDSCIEHRNYLQKLSEDFETSVKDLLHRSIDRETKSILNDTLYEEVLHHTMFCQRKYRSFFGRNDLLEKIKSYILDKQREPLVIHGTSGCGKTSVLAKAASDMKEWTQGKAAVIIRFLGTTVASSDANSVMTSVTQQAQYIFSYSRPATSDRKKIEIQFHEALQKSSAECPLILVLDSLDQLHCKGPDCQLNWLLRDQLPPHTKMVLSTLPEKEYGCFPKLQEWLKDENQLLQVKPLSIPDVRSILDYWLRSNNRTLRPHQRSTLLDAYENYPLPLYLKLSIDSACEWHSYSEPHVTVLQPTVESSINSLFQATENKHGRLLVSRALGYLTLSENGLSESELEDLLSCDEEVLNAVYVYWTPPIRRLPPLLWVRIKNDLEEYLVNRGSDGIQVLYWYHRQFIEVATHRYCSDINVREKLFRGLIEFFSGTWADGRTKPYVGRNGQSGRSDRLVSSQPIQFNNRPNLRKLNMLPFLLIHGDSLEQLKRDVLLNFSFLFTKLKATCVMEVLNDFSLALERFPAEEDLSTINKALLLSQNALDYDPTQLVTQFIGRLSTAKVVRSVVQQCRESEFPYLESNNGKSFVLPGGRLLHSIPTHKKKIISFDMSSDRKTAVTLCSGGMVKFWNLNRGIQQGCYECNGDKPEKVQFCCQDKFVAINPNRSINFITVNTASFSFAVHSKSLRDDESIGGESDGVGVVDGRGNSSGSVGGSSGGGGCIFAPEPFFEVCGPGGGLIMFHCIYNLFVWDVSTRKLRNKIYLENEEIGEEINSTTQAAGSDQYFALLVTGIILVVHLKSGASKYIDTSSIEEIADIDGIGICPLNSILYFGCPETGILYSCNLKLWGEDRITQLKKLETKTYEKFLVSADGKSIYFSTKTSLQCLQLITDQYFTVIPQNGADMIDFGIINKAMAVSVSIDRNLRIWDVTLVQSDTQNSVTSTQSDIRQVTFTHSDTQNPVTSTQRDTHQVTATQSDIRQVTFTQSDTQNPVTSTQSDTQNKLTSTQSDTQNKLTSTQSDTQNQLTSTQSDTQNPVISTQNHYDSDNVCTGSIRKIQPLENSRYVAFEVGFGPLYWYVYDVWDSKVILELKLVKCKTATLISDTKIAVVTCSNCLKIADLLLCQIIGEFNEPLDPEVNFVSVKNGQEILLLSEKDDQLKAFNTQTGTCHLIAAVDHGVTSLWANNNSCSNHNGSPKSCNVGLAVCIKDHTTSMVSVINLLKYTVIQTVRSSDIKNCRAFLNNIMGYRPVTNDGLSMIVLVERILTEGGHLQCIRHPVVWSIDLGRVQCMLVDQDSMGEDSSVKSASFLSNDELVLSNHEDNIMRIFSAQSGCLLKRLEQHHSNISTIILPNLNHNFLLSASSEEVGFCLWRGDTFERIVTIILDEKPSTIIMTQGGQVICGRNTKSGSPITVWTLRNSPIEYNPRIAGKHIEKFHTQSFHNVLNMMRN